MQTGKHFKLMFTFLSAGYILLGLFLLLMPDLANRLLCYIMGGIAVIMGLMRVAFFFTKDDVAEASRNDLAVGVVFLALGVYLFTQPGGLLSLLPVVLGFAILYDSVIKATLCFDLRQAKFKAWWVLLLLSCVTLAASILLVANPFGIDVARIYFGCTLVGDGVVNLVVLLFTLFFRKRLKELAAPAAAPDAKAKPMPEDVPTEAAPAETPVEPLPTAQATSPQPPAPQSPAEEDSLEVFDPLRGEDE